MTLEEDDANDYVGKGHGGRQTDDCQNLHSAAQETTIISNTCLYGATTAERSMPRGLPATIYSTQLWRSGRC
jgi:hypothetical protein